MPQSTTDRHSQTASVDERRRRAGPVSVEALARLAFLLQRPLGCGVVVGPARSGKSALLRALATASERSLALTAYLDGQGIDARNLMWELAAEWRLAPAVDGHTRQLSQQVRDYVHGATSAGERMAIMLDHADRLDHSAYFALSRMLHDVESRGGLTLIWAAEGPIRGDAAEFLLPFTELRIDCPAMTLDETAQFARNVWEQTSDSGTMPVDIAQQIATLSKLDLRRTERLCRLSQLATLAEVRPIDHEMVTAAASELP